MKKPDRLNSLLVKVRFKQSNSNEFYDQIYFIRNISDDTPLIAQFAANTVHEYSSAAEMVYPYVDGIDLNCGCPQRWAMQSGFGCALLKDPELIKDLTSTLRRTFPNDFSVSVKIRVEKPITYVFVYQNIYSLID